MNSALLLVHGAGKTEPNYAAETLAAITLLLGAEPPCVPVYYADVTRTGPLIGIASAPGGQSIPATESPQVTHFKMAFAMQVQHDMNALPPGEKTVTVAELPGQTLAELISDELNQIAGYLFNPLTYKQVQSRMYDGLDKAGQLASSIVLVGHSLGAVVAFDALRAIGALFEVSTFITLGSPLAKLRRLGNRSADLGAINHDHVRSWLNFYDTTDPIANPLGPVFPLQGYRLRDVFVDVASSPIPAHDYLHNPEVLAEIANALKWARRNKERLGA